MRDLWHIRIFDAWIPQQDMRRAVKRPGDLEGPGAEHAVGCVAMAMPRSAGRTVALRMEGGRARSLDEIPVTPTVRLSLDVETFTCLGCGRWNPAATLQQRKVQVTGDTALGQVIVAQMNLMI
jgi:SCP-2 sterol transfer family